MRRPGPRLWLGAALVLALAYVGWASTWIVQQNQQGVVQRFGRVSRPLLPGIHFTLPWPVESLVTVETTQVRTMPVGFNLVDKSNNLPPRDVEVQWLSGDTNIVELQATVQYAISDPVRYLFGVSAMDGDRPRDFLVRKVAEAVLTRLVAGTTIDSVLAEGKNRLQRVAVDDIQKLLDELGVGIHVTGINIVEISPPQSVKEFFNDFASAKQDRERMILEARGDTARSLPRARSRANEMLEEARTYASALVARAHGAAESFKKIAQEVSAQPDLARRRLWLDSMGRILIKVEKRIVPRHSRVYLTESD